MAPTGVLYSGLRARGKSMSAKRIENTIPVLPVRDLSRSAEFLERVLGFRVEWKAPGVCSVARDGCSIMLRRSAEDAPATVWIGLVDEALFADVQASGATIVQAPTKQPWAYEMKVADPDGNTLWLGTGGGDD